VVATRFCRVSGTVTAHAPARRCAHAQAIGQQRSSGPIALSRRARRTSGETSGAWKRRTFKTPTCSLLLTASAATSTSTSPTEVSAPTTRRRATQRSRQSSSLQADVRTAIRIGSVFRRWRRRETEVFGSRFGCALKHCFQLREPGFEKVMAEIGAPHEAGGDLAFGLRHHPDLV